LAERQVLLRTPGRVSSFQLTTKKQLVGILLLSAAIGWATLASLDYARHGSVVAEKNQQIASAHQAYRDLLLDLSEQRVRIDHLSRDVTQSRNQHEQKRRLVEQMSDWAVNQISRAEALITRTGIEGSALLEVAESQGLGKGGPMIGVASAEDSLVVQMRHWDQLQGILKRLPLSPPLDSFAVTSSYGYRRDPMTQKRAFHEGVDLVAAMRAPVYATAPGTVTFAGRKKGYGRFIQISHGSGIKTRFGHLAKILVKKGQRVEFHQQIGLLGSSGRSTGPHLHYEVLFNGKPKNPMNFVKAGWYVLQEQSSLEK
jgi:murein DD-endopeptidase MepM/ murein hydrolase activator NlpD